MSEKDILRNLKKTISSANINFLIGSGLSSPFLDILHNIETDLTEAESAQNLQRVGDLKKEYFEKCMLRNIEILHDTPSDKKDGVLSSYQNFYRSINYLLLKREDSILTKQVNVFTTNVDIFSEKSLENTSIEFNDGFSGRFKPTYSAGNYKKSVFKKSLHYENTSEIPIFNILKLHGSLSWRKEGEDIGLDQDLLGVKNATDELYSNLFEEAFEELMVINPTKKKFEDTVLVRYFYDLLRVYSNELEKENSVLFVMGFSFADELIKSLTLQVANSNPTLMIYIFSHGLGPNTIYENLAIGAKNKNIEVLYPEEDTKYDLKTITENYFDKLVLDQEISDDLTEAIE